MYTLAPTQLTVYFPRHAEDQIREKSDAPGALAHRPQQSATLLAADRAEARARRRDRRRRRSCLCTRRARPRPRRTQGTDPQKQRRPAEVPPGGLGQTVTREGISVTSIISHRSQFTAALLAVPLRRHVHRSALFALERLLERRVFVDRRDRRHVLGVVGLILRAARPPRRRCVLFGFGHRFPKCQLVDSRLATLLLLRRSR